MLPYNTSQTLLAEPSIGSHATRFIVAVRQQSFPAEGVVSKRGLTLMEAAEYCGISPSTYRCWMGEGRVPGYWPNTRRIDRVALEAALDKMSGRDEQTTLLTPFEVWEAEKNATA